VAITVTIMVTVDTAVITIIKAAVTQTLLLEVRLPEVIRPMATSCRSPEDE
jgi:hypothetical protein